MQNKYSELLDAIAETIKGREDDIFATDGTADEAAEKITEIENS